MLKRFPRLETIANLTVILTCVALVYVVVSARFSSRPAPADTRAAPYALGESLEPVSGLDHATAERSFVLFFRTSCRPCQDSLPFYRVIGRKLHERADLRFVAVTTESMMVGAEYLKDANVPVSGVYAVQPRTTKVRSTPTLLLVDKRGNIAGAWEGRLSQAQEEEVLRIVGAPLAVTQLSGSTGGKE